MGKKNAIKVRFNVTVKSAFNLGAESDGKPYTIAWKRGSKSKNRGQTKKVEAKGGIVTFGETFTLVATMLQDEKSKKFDTKKLELLVKEEDKKSREVGKLTIELGDYASAGKHGPFTVALGDDKKSKKASKDGRGSPSIKFDVESEWTHFNKKKITDKKKEGKDGVEIDGVEYGLETDTSEVSEDDATTLGDMSESESEIESEEEEDSGDEGMREMSAPVKSKSSGSSDDLKASSGSVPSKKALKEEKVKDKQIAKLEKEVSKLKDELTQAKESMRDKTMKATGSQQEVKQLKKELAEAKKQSGKGGGGGGGGGASDDSDLRKELEDAKKTIKDMQDDLRKKESELKLTSTSFRELKETQGKEGKDADTLRKELQEKDAELKEKNRLFLQLKEDFETLKKATEGGSNGKKGDDTDKLKKEIESLRRELESVQKKSSAGAAGAAGASDELEETQAKLKKAKKEIDEKEKRIDELQQLVLKAGASASSAAGGESVEALKKQVDKQKADIKALNKENRERKDKIDTLQQELDRAKDRAGGGSDSKEIENMRKKLNSLEKEKEEDELIEREIYCMTTKYREGVHASAHNICTTLMQWGVLDDPPNERLLSKILSAIKKGYKVATDDNSALIKWLSFATNLHEQLENEVGTSEDENSGDIPENGIHIFRDSGKSGNEDDDDPVSIFFHNLETIIFEIYSAFLKNIYAHIDDVIVPAILQPIVGRDRRGPSQRDARGSRINGGKNKSNALPSTGLTNILSEHLEMLHKYHIFDSVIKQFFCQVFYYINTRLFNNLLRQEELCSCGSGFQIKLGLSQLEEWISKADKNDKKHLSQAAKRYLLHITEAANVLVVDKDIFTDEEMIENVFPTLTVPQIKFLLEHFQTDQYAPNPVPRNVMATLDGLSRQRKGQKVVEVDEAYLLSLPKDKNAK
jgi:DNA repair ATPase RecN